MALPLPMGRYSSDLMDPAPSRMSTPAVLLLLSARDGVLCAASFQNNSRDNLAVRTPGQLAHGTLDTSHLAPTFYAHFRF